MIFALHSKMRTSYDPEAREELEFYRKSWRYRLQMNLCVEFALWQEAATRITDFQGLKNLIDPKRRIGLLEGTLLQNPLYLPHREGKVISLSGKGEPWVAYDYQRPEILRKKISAPLERNIRCLLFG